MSFPRYPKYKPSGVEWLGEVPAHWEVKPLKAVASFNDEVLPESFSADEEIEYVDIGSVSLAGGIERMEPFQYGNAPSRARRRVRDGDVIASTVRTYLKAIAPIIDPPANMIVSTGFAVIRPGVGLVPHFAKFALQTNFFVDAVISLSTGVSYPAINASEMAGIAVTVPSLAEQTKIAAFLDRETTKIDELVAEQRRLMGLLKEKRQAVISHAVTQGLNPKAPMKPSGVEWLGDVPEHWEVKPLKYSITKIEQGWSPQCGSEPAAENEWGVLKVGCGNRDRFDPNEQKALPLDLAPLTNYEIKSGDILMSRGNTLELVGSATYIEQVRPRLLLCDLLYRFRAKPDRAASEFLVLILRSPNVRFQIERDATGTSSSMKKIGQGTIREFVIALPPLDEQLTIIDMVKIETANLDALTAEAQRAIDLLQERRTALISAAVTGQIDVRNP